MGSSRSSSASSSADLLRRGRERQTRAREELRSALRRAFPFDRLGRIAAFSFEDAAWPEQELKRLRG